MISFLSIKKYLYIFDQGLSFLTGINPASAISIVLLNLKKVFVETLSSNKLILIVLLLLYSIMIYLLNENTFTLKSIFSLSVIILIFLIIDKIDLYKIITERSINHQLLFIILFFLVVDYLFAFDLKDYFTGAVRGSGLFNERSHLAIYSLPLIFFSLLRFKSSLPYALIAFSVLFFNSLTLIVGLALFFGTLFLKSLVLYPLRSLKYIIIIFLVFILAILQLDFLYARVEGVLLFIDNLDKIKIITFKELETYLSGLVWINGWVMAYDNLVYSNFLGLGFNNMGINPNAGLSFPSHFGYNYDILNAEDGSFLASKLVSEFGLIGVLILLVLSYMCFRNIIRFCKTKNEDSYNLIISLKFISSILLLSYLFVRGIGYFQLSFLLYLHILFLNQNLAEKDYEK